MLQPLLPRLSRRLLPPPRVPASRLQAPRRPRLGLPPRRARAVPTARRLSRSARSHVWRASPSRSSPLCSCKDSKRIIWISIVLSMALFLPWSTLRSVVYRAIYRISTRTFLYIPPHILVPSFLLRFRFPCGNFLNEISLHFLLSGLSVNELIYRWDCVFDRLPEVALFPPVCLCVVPYNSYSL